MTPAHEKALADEIDLDLGERFYKDSKELEARLIDDIIAIIRRFVDRRFQEGRRPALRDAHAKDNGCVKAIFRVDSDLDPQFQHGVLMPGKEYEAWIRFSNANSEINSGRAPDARGMAIKLMGVDGPKLLDDEQRTQDFILVNHPVFFVDDLERYRETLVVFHSGGRLQQYLSLLKLKFREIRLAFRVNISFMLNPLSHQYWSMTPYRLGPASGPKMAVKFTAKPRLPDTANFLKRWITFLAPGFSLKREMQKTLSGREAHFDFYLQQHIDQRTPIEDSTVEWKESVSVPRHVATIIVPLQDLMSIERATFCENLSFSPWHCLAEHKPLGAVNRVRKSVYRAISQQRRMLNGVPRTEPRAEAENPAGYDP